MENDEEGVARWRGSSKGRGGGIGLLATELEGEESTLGGVPAEEEWEMIGDTPEGNMFGVD